MGQIEQGPLENLITEKERLDHKLASASDVFSHIETPGWINQKNPRAFNLRLDVDPLTKFRNLDERIVVIKANLARVIPEYNTRLEELNVEITAQASEVKEVSLTAQIPEEEIISGALEDFNQIRKHKEMTLFLERIPKETAVLIEKFLGSQQASRILTQVKKFHPKDEAESNFFGGDLSGAIFEQISYHHLTSVYSRRPDFLILSPQEVFTLYRRMFPERQITNSSGVLHGIRGITYPDGLIIRETNSALIIDALMEYKLGKSGLSRLERQLQQGYSYDLFLGKFFQSGITDQLFHGKILNELRSEIPVKPVAVNPNLEIIIGVPENYTDMTLESIEDVTCAYIPFHSAIFGRFIDLLRKIVRE